MHKKLLYLILIIVLSNSCVTINSVADSTQNAKYKRVLVVLPSSRHRVPMFITNLKVKMEEQLSERSLLVDNLDQVFEDDIKLNTDIKPKIDSAAKSNHDDLVLHFTIVGYDPSIFTSLTYEIVATDCATKKEVWKADDSFYSFFIGPYWFNTLNAKKIILKLQEDGIIQ